MNIYAQEKMGFFVIVWLLHTDIPTFTMYKGCEQKETLW